MRRVDQLRSLRYEDGLRNHALVGTPEAIAERLKTLRREIGLTGILAETQLRRPHSASTGADSNAAAVRGASNPALPARGISPQRRRGQFRHVFRHNLAGRTVASFDEKAGAVRGFEEVELDRVRAGATGFFDKTRRRLDAA